MKPELFTLHINGRPHTVALAPNVTLLHALRDLGYVDVKCGCEQGDCGACAVLLDGVAVNSCLVLVGQADGCRITTAAGLGSVSSPTRCTRRSPTAARSNAVIARPASSSRRRRCWTTTRTPPKPRFARRSRAISAGVRGTGRSWKRFRWRRSEWRQQIADGKWQSAICSLQLASSRMVIHVNPTQTPPPPHPARVTPGR